MSAKDGPTGPQKVAAFLLSLEREAAANVMKGLDPAIVPHVADAMSDLREELPPERVDALYNELARTLNRKTGIAAPAQAELGAMLTKAYGREKAEQIVERMRQRERRERPFAFLESRPPEVVQRLLAQESPAVAALVLAHLPPALTSGVLGRCAPEAMLAIVKCLSTLVPPDERVLASVADELRTRLPAAERVPPVQDPALRKKQIAAVLKLAQPEVERTVLEGLEDQDQAMVAEIREFMFAWGDLATVDKRAMQKILASVDTRTLAISLKGCPPDVESNIMDNLSSRVRDMVVDERELAGPMPMAEVLTARKEMLDSVRALIESGEMQTQRGGEELVS